MDHNDQMRAAAVCRLPSHDTVTFAHASHSDSGGARAVRDIFATAGIHPIVRRSKDVVSCSRDIIS